MDTANALAFRIADLTLAVGELNSHHFVALHPWRRNLVVATEQSETVHTTQFDDSDWWATRRRPVAYARSSVRERADAASLVELGVEGSSRR